MLLGSGRPEVFEFGRESLASEGTFDSRSVESLRLDCLIDPVQDTRNRYDELEQNAVPVEQAQEKEDEKASEPGLRDPV